MHKHIKSAMQAVHTSTVAMAAVLATALMLTAPVLQAKEKPADDANWSEWKALGDGYVARRRQPPKLDLPKAERKLANVQDRLDKLLKQKERLLAKKVKPGKQTKKRDKQLAVLDKRIAKRLNKQTRITSTISSSALVASASTSVTSSKTAWLRTGQEGLYEVSIADLAAELGKNVDQIKRKASKGTLALTTAEQLDSESATRPVSWYYDENSESILFVGEAYDTFHSDENAYKFKLVGKNSKIAKPMEIIEGEAAVNFGSDTPFREMLKFEEEPDLLYSIWAMSAEPDGDFWFWDYMFGSKNSIEISLEIPNPVNTGFAQIRATLRGFTSLNQGNDHHVYAELNGASIGTTVIWDDLQEAILIADFDQGLLNPSGDNSLIFHSLQNQENASGQLLDQVEVDYQRQPIAKNGKLRLHDVAAGTQTVSGFTSSDIFVFESSVDAVVLRKDVHIEDVGGSWSVSFEAKGGVDYYLSESSQIVQAGILSDNKTGLRNRKNSADYLIIAPQDFKQSAEALAAYRGSRYSNVKIVWLDDIYNEFSAGREDPYAIGRFMRYAERKWNSIPVSVLLYGKGSLDQKDRMSYSDNFIPVLMTENPWSLAASDSRLLGYEDNAPFVIGRLPITSDVEGFAYLDKLRDYESSLPSSEKFEAVLIADNPDDAGDFHTNSDLLADRLLGSLGFNIVTKLYHPDVNVRASLIDTATWNTGYVSYDGHGSSSQVGNYSEKFITTSDASSLNNTVYPVFTALTCSAGDDAAPGIRSLASSLVLNPTGGAIVSIAPAGFSSDADAQKLSDSLVDNLFGSNSSIGEALRNAKLETNGVISSFMPRMYNVIGDPAVYSR